MAIHFKIYPIIFSLPLYSALRGPSSTSSIDTIGSYIRSLFDFNQARIRLVLGKEQVALFLLLNWWKIQLIFLCSINLMYWPNIRFFFILGTCLTFIILTSICYLGYGWEFLEESYLHHLTRRDTRHNFSVYFYMLYLTVEDDDIGISLLTFVPQLLLLLAISKVSMISYNGFIYYWKVIIIMKFIQS